MATFDCPECSHESSHWSKWTGMVTVAIHFWREHPEEAAAWGDPRESETAPAPEQFKESKGEQ